MPSAFDRLLPEIITRATSDIAGAVRAKMADEIARAVNVSAPKTPAVRAAAQSRQPQVAAVPARKAVPGGRHGSGLGGADDARILAYVTAHPGQRAEEIIKGVGLRKEDVASGLLRLWEVGKLKMHGVKRAAARYAAGGQ